MEWTTGEAEPTGEDSGTKSSLNRQPPRARLRVGKGSYSFSLKLKKTLGTVFGKMIVPVLHLDMFTSNLSSNIPSLFTVHGAPGYFKY